MYVSARRVFKLAVMVHVYTAEWIIQRTHFGYVCLYKAMTRIASAVAAAAAVAM